MTQATVQAEVQADVFAFLRQPSSWPQDPAPAAVDVIETHGAKVFLAGGDVLKVKRAVRLPYLDFSTLEARHAYLQREIEINAPHAPEIYLNLVAITRESDGRLAIGGSGRPVEWALRMRRFAQDQLMARYAGEQRLTRNLAVQLADAVVRYHRTAPVQPDATDPMPAIFEPVMAHINEASGTKVRAVARDFERGVRASLARSAPVREQRAQSGFIRRCHGDLHLGNVVVWNGEPVPFDAIEFDEKLATIDTLYDLAFLLMDLERHGARAAANTILNRYLWRTGDPADLQGLQALPAFMSIRAGIRAMVALDRARLGTGYDDCPIDHAIDTLEQGTSLATPGPARLVVAGGLSGTGKTTLAAALAPAIGAAPGAIHIRTDLERKWLFGADEFETLPPAAYSKHAAARVYERVETRTRLALAAGHAVVLDGVFAQAHEREAAARLARDAGVPFTGFWLAADPGVMMARVAARTHDASDATPRVVESQLALDTGVIDWLRLDAGGTPGEVLARAHAVLKVAPH